MWFRRYRRTRPPVPLATDAKQLFAAAVALAQRWGDEVLTTEHFLIGFSDTPLPATQRPPRGKLFLSPTLQRIFFRASAHACERGARRVDRATLLQTLASDQDSISSTLLPPPRDGGLLQ